MIKVTQENYFSPEVAREYMSASQVKAFQKCEAAALAEIRGEWHRPETTALLVGSYVDAHFSGTLDIFKAQNPQIFTRSGDLKAEYRAANDIISRMESDAVMMDYLTGESQVVFTGDLFGVPSRAMADVYAPGNRIVDMKIMRDFGEVYITGSGRLPFVEAWGYDIQGAIYRHLEGNRLPFYLAAATKEPVPDIAVIDIPPDVLDNVMEWLEDKVPRYAAIKRGVEEPERCECCDYCKATKVLDGPVDYRWITLH